MTFWISVDTGGTFTDVVIADAHGIRAIGKALSTPNRIFDGMRAAIDVAAQEVALSGKALLSKSDMLIYGTTRSTNAVVTRSTAKTAFLTKRGFRDVLVFKEGGKYDPHDYSYDYPPTYIPRRYTGLDRPRSIFVAQLLEAPLGDARRAERRQRIAVPLIGYTDARPAHESIVKARDIYGVVFTGRIEDDSLAVDAVATKARRAELGAAVKRDPAAAE
jgi:N-methylhydantoinase A